jgi:hypothetical protein
MRENGILRVVARFLIPLIMLFGLYIQFHGEYSLVAVSRPVWCLPRVGSCSC